MKVRRQPPPRRPVEERIRDYAHVYQRPGLPELRMQASRCMDCGVPFCTTGCPLGNLIPDWNDLVHRDQWQSAVERLHRTNNFPEFTGLLCPAPCEAACVLAINDDAVTIKDVELEIINRAFDEGWVSAQPPPFRTGRRVAIVGSGPAGLAAAQELNRRGHWVTVFERDDKLGGLLRYGIPDYKIEKWVVDRRLDLLRDEGIELIPNAYVGENPTTDELLGSYDAVLLAVGALQGRELPAPGRDLAGIHLAMDYLTQQNRRVAGESMDPHEEITARGKRVVILGGGDTSADCLGNAHREGAISVQVLTHGPQPPDTAHPLAWPDWPFILRIHPAHEEGGERRWAVQIEGFSGNSGRVQEMHAIEVQRLPDGTTRPIPGTQHVVEADLVLLAIGFAGPVRDRLHHDLALDYERQGAIRSDEQFRTSTPNVYVAGDAKRGASLIVWAIQEGRKAAQEIDGALARTNEPEARAQAS